MLVGVLSDSHDHVRPVQSALQLFDSLGVEFIIHCGDVGGEEVFGEFVGRSFAFVWGNTDEASSGLRAYLATVGIQLPKNVPVMLDLGGKRFAVFHGHERSFGQAFDLPDVDYVLHGHTHIARNDRQGAKRFINPGALHRSPRKSVATIDTAIDRVVFHDIGV